MLKVNVYGTYYDGCLFEVGNEVVVYGYYSYRDYEATPNISYASEIAAFPGTMKSPTHQQTYIQSKKSLP